MPKKSKNKEEALKEKAILTMASWSAIKILRGEEDAKILNDFAKALNYYRKEYYKGTPKITDHHYDLLEDALKLKYPDHPLLNEVGH